MTPRQTLCTLSVAVALLAPAAAGGDELTGSGIVSVGIGGAGARTVSITSGDVRSRGSLIVTFQGDPATCAAAGTCGTSGTVTWRPADDYRLEAGEFALRSGKRSLSVFLLPHYGAHGPPSPCRRSTARGLTAAPVSAPTPPAVPAYMRSRAPYRVYPSGSCPRAPATSSPRAAPDRRQPTSPRCCPPGGFLARHCARVT